MKFHLLFKTLSAVHALSSTFHQFTAAQTATDARNAVTNPRTKHRLHHHFWLVFETLLWKTVNVRQEHANNPTLSLELCTAQQTSQPSYETLFAHRDVKQPPLSAGQSSPECHTCMAAFPAIPEPVSLWGSACRQCWGPLTPMRC